VRLPARSPQRDTVARNRASTCRLVSPPWKWCAGRRVTTSSLANLNWSKVSDHHIQVACSLPTYIAVLSEIPKAECMSTDTTQLNSTQLIGLSRLISDSRARRVPAAAWRDLRQETNSSTKPIRSSHQLLAIQIVLFCRARCFRTGRHFCYVASDFSSTHQDAFPVFVSYHSTVFLCVSNREPCSYFVRIVHFRNV